jgi:hypothetical protein
MSHESKSQDWSKPAAMAIPKGGFLKDKVEQGRYGPIFPKSPACYGFSILAKVIPGREEVFYKYAHRAHPAPALPGGWYENRVAPGRPSPGPLRVARSTVHASSGTRRLARDRSHSMTRERRLLHVVTRDTMPRVTR